MGKTLIAYYSRRGENYVNGSIKNLKLGTCAHNKNSGDRSAFRNYQRYLKRKRLLIEVSGVNK